MNEVEDLFFGEDIIKGKHRHIVFYTNSSFSLGASSDMLGR